MPTAFQPPKLDVEATLALYMPVLRVHLKRAWHLNEDQSDDLLQAFVQKRILEKSLLSKVDPQKGNLRSFLRVALDNFVRNEFREASAQKRRPTGSLVGQVEMLNLPARDESGGVDVFDLAWAREVIAESLVRMMIECETHDRMAVWGVFAGRIAGPTADGSKPASFAELADRFDLESARQASNLLLTAKRIFARTMHHVVADYVESEDDVSLEMEHVRQILGLAMD